MNWLTLVPWAISAFSLLLGGGYGLIEHDNYLEEKTARVNDTLDAVNAVAAAKNADAARTKAIEDAHAKEVTTLKEQANARDVSIAQTPVTGSCANSPAMRALFDGLRARHGAAGPGQSRSAGGAGHAMP